MKKTLYFGLEDPLEEGVVHYPLLWIEPLKIQVDPSLFTHLILTSKTSVEILSALPKHPFREHCLLSVGKKTTQRAIERGFTTLITAKDERAEGVLELLKELDRTKCSLFYPHSKRARPLIKDTLLENQFFFKAEPLYEVHFQAPFPRPNLEAFDRIVLTSPTTVQAFFYYFKTLPSHLEIDCIGPITRNCLTSTLNNLYTGDLMNPFI